MTEGRLPPDDEPFEWTDAPPRPRRRRREPDPFETGEREPFESGTGEREASETGERTYERDPFDTGEGTSEREMPQPGDPYDPPGWETSERDPYDTTGERAYPPDDDPFETGERRRARGDTGERRGRRPPTGRHRRHRDLPANVRRRQAIGAIVAVLAVLAGGYVLAFGGGGGGDEEQPLSVKKLAGQTIIGRMGPGGPDKRLLKQARKGQIGGLIAESDPEGRSLNPQDLKADVARIQKATRSGDNPPLLIMTDQEGGFVKEIPGPPDIAPNDLGSGGDANVAKVEGQKTAGFLAPLGVNIDLAPLMDVNIPQTADTIKTRTFGEDPALVSEIGVGFIQGLQEGGVSATAKHFPGLGLSTVNPDFRRVDIAATPQDLEAAVIPFQAAVDAGVDLVMMSSAIYTDLGSQDPAVFSPEIVQGQLRDQLGFAGLIITDDLEARAIVDVTSPEEAGVAALNAGNDLLLYAGDEERTWASALNGLRRATKKGALDRAVIEAAYERVTAFKATLGGG